jgi:hypothetical protein
MKFYIYIFILLLINSNECFGQINNELLIKCNKLEKQIDSNMETHPEIIMQLAKQQNEKAQVLDNDSLKINAELKEAEALFNLGIYDECLRMRYKLLAELEKQKQDNRIAELVLQTGWVYFELQDCKRYKDFAEKAKKLFIETKNYTDTIRCNTEIGLGYLMLNENKIIFKLLIESKELAKRYITDPFNKTLIFDNLSIAYTQIGDHQNALKNQLDVEEAREKVLKSWRRKSNPFTSCFF